MINNKKSFIEIDNISKRFAHNHEATLNEISLDIEEGEIFALLGTSGCGKSTLLRIIAGFEHPDSGSIKINGEDILKIPAYKRPVNMMFQNYALFPHMTILDNVAFGLKQEKLPSHLISKRVNEALEMLGLINFAKRYPNQISGGQQQRVALARSIVKRPKLLLLDEPLGSLDRNTRERTQVELIKIQDYLNLTFIIVTHDQDEAMSLADRIGVIKEGKLLQIGTPEDIYENPQSKYVANFVGSINLFEGEVIKHKNEIYQIQINDLNVLVSVLTDKKYNIGEKICLAIRPEELTIASRKPKQSDNFIEGKIIDIGFLGSEIFYHLQLLNQQIIHVSVPTAARSKNPSLSIGKNAYIAWHDSDGVILRS